MKSREQRNYERRQLRNCFWNLPGGPFSTCGLWDLFGGLYRPDCLLGESPLLQSLQEGLHAQIHWAEFMTPPDDISLSELVVVETL